MSTGDDGGRLGTSLIVYLECKWGGERGGGPEEEE